MDREQKVGKVLGELESEIMEIIWQSSGPVSVRDVTLSLQKKRQIAYTTVMTIMGRLVEKGLLEYQKRGKVYFYHPVFSKEKFLTRVSRQLIKNFIDRFGDVAIAHFAKELEKLTPMKRKELLKILHRSKR
ncbi:BlaI/MecI/CopY family transcriptional regulator [Candidatus Daviesbacteria bacterium]|nr:BlaI/MecI/CopY family transcriptional regulator [Candidatus Daviesbacteria bacterium]